MNKTQKIRLRRLPAHNLVLSHLLIIIATCIIFSSVFYIASVPDIDKKSIEFGLLILNIIALVIGVSLSYWLARRTLRPIEKALEKQDQYIANASHGLRTPLASALLSNEVALKNVSLTLLQARAIIEGNVKDMQELRMLSDELLQESKNQSSALNLKSVNTHKVAQEAVRRFIIVAGIKKIIIKNNTSMITLTTDADRLRKVLMILIENAIKYSPARSTIIITSRYTQATVAFVVTDQGIGIDADDLGNIFTRFYRSSHSKSYAAGYGLGLSIAMKLVEDMGGTLSVESISGAGSEFTVQLPAAANNFESAQ